MVVKDVSIELDEDLDSGFLFFEFQGLEGERVDLIIPNHLLRRYPASDDRRAAQAIRWGDQLRQFGSTSSNRWATGAASP